MPVTSIVAIGSDLYISSSNVDLCRISLLRGYSVEDIALL